MTGHVEEARRMGDFLVDNLIGENPDLTKAFYPIWDTQRGLRTDGDAPPAPNMPRVLLRDTPEQHHFLTGFIMAYLTDLYRITADVKYLDGAITMYEFADGGTDELYRRTASHKFGWGCSMLYRETGDAQHLESACRIADFLVDEAQDSDGSMVHYSFIDSSTNWAYSPRLNITAQFALWIKKALDLL